MARSHFAILRIGILVGGIAPQFRRVAFAPLVAIFAFRALIGCWSLHPSGAGSASLPEQNNLVELKPALLFGLLYAVVRVGVVAANQHLAGTHSMLKF